PGVEAGKKAAASILDLQKRVMQVLKGAEEPLSLAVLAEKANAAEEVETVYQIVRHLEANRRGVILTGDLARPDSLTFSAT
ncbi:MAG: glucose-6-phosphate isomerase, partial [Prochloraceae cyanobacterium]|nr:glucose-6-phosphate isomerase [Prochloraceae cyanobacterium]